MNGTIKWFNTNRGFGFICSSGKEDDYFFHISQVLGAQLPNNGDSVTFSTELGKNGKLVAKKITITKKATPASKSPYYANPKYVDVHGTWGGRGAAAGAATGVMLGGPLGGLVGVMLGAVAGDSITSGRIVDKIEITNPCLRCGGTGQVTSEVDDRFGFQCPRCKKFWSKRVEQVYEDLNIR